MKNLQSEFAFIVHSRDRNDLPRKFPLLRLIPVKLFDLITLHLPPFIVSNITGLLSKKGKNLNGLVIGIPMTAHQLLENRSLALKRIIQSVGLAKSKGARYIGLGAMTASLSKGGKDVIDLVPDVFVTTGRTYTVKNITGYITHCCDLFKIDKQVAKVGIVGAAGGIGSGVAIALAIKGYKNFVLIDLERKLDNLKRHIEVLEKHAPDLRVTISHRLGDINPCDFIVAATSSPEIVIKSEDVSSGTIIVNDAQPSDISPDIIKNRQDVLVIEGGVLHTPSINCHFNFGLAHKEDIFSCLAETLLLTHMNESKHYSINNFDVDLCKTLENKASMLGYKMCIQNDMGIVNQQRLLEFAKIVASRHAS